MSDLSTFDPASVQDLIDKIEDDAGTALTQYWNVAKARIGENTRVLAETTVRVAKGLADGSLSEADADSILYVQEQLFNATLNSVRNMPYVAAQKGLNAIFKVVGWVVFNRTGINLFPALVS